jgi:DNA polymerase elongation subunit (family B)
MTKPKILLWDIETADLDADLGHILCIGYKWLGEKTVNVISRMEEDDWPTAGRNLWDDRLVIKNFLPVIAQADDQVTWYGKKFDEPYVRSRMLHWGFKNDFPPVHHTDLWYVSRFELKLSNNRLATVGKFLQLEEGKLHLPVLDWKQAAMGCKKAMRRVEKRVASDVFLLEEAYLKLRPFIRANRLNHGAVMVERGICPACGSKKVHKRGSRATLTNLFHRWQCQDCGAWSSSPKTRYSSNKLR